jgi:hypothetical protein
MIRLAALLSVILLGLAFGSSEAKADAGNLYYPGGGGTTKVLAAY